MHRTKRVPGFALGLLLFGLTALAVGTAAAQPLPPPAPVMPIVVPRGSTIPIQMSTKKLIKDIQQDAPGVVDIKPDKADPTRVLVSGLTPGISHATLTDVDGRREVFDFIVQTDVEYLKYMLRRAVPTAAVEPIPSANNAFLLTGTVQKAEDVQIVIDTVRSVVGDRVINALRVGGVQQVELCVTIARVARSMARSMGFSFFENGQQHYVSSILSSPLTLTGNSSASSFAGGGTATGSALANLAGSPNVIFGILNDKQNFVGFLEALKTQNLVKILAEPKLVALSGRPAQFVSGGAQAVPQIASGSAGGGAVSGVQFVPFGTTVQFLPIVLGDGKIYLEVQPQFTFPDPTPLFSTPLPGTNGVVFGRTVQSVQTSILLEDGQTFAIGGMVFRSVNGNATRVPVLGDLPFIGTAFSTINYTESEEELIVLVTPHLVDPLDCKQMPKYLPGQETRSPDDFELFLERILEAPRGPRRPCNGLHYTAAYKNDPMTQMLPCMDSAHGVHGRCDLGGGCPSSACGSLNVPPCCTPGGGCGPGGCGGQAGCGTCGQGGCNGSNGNAGPAAGVPGSPLPIDGAQPMPGPVAPTQQLPQRVPVTTAPTTPQATGELATPAVLSEPAAGETR